MKNKPMSERGRKRVMYAAAQVDTASAREAAILGGIVRCAIDTGHFSESYVKHYVPEAMTWFAATHTQLSRRPLTRSDLKPPTGDEIAAMLKRFTRYYDPPELVAA